MRSASCQAAEDDDKTILIESYVSGFSKSYADKSFKKNE